MEFEQGVNYMALGVMSGSSLDGLDVIAVNFRQDAAWSFEILKEKTYKFPKTLVPKLKQGSRLPIEQYLILEQEFSDWVAKKINDFKSDINETPLCVGIHGQTLLHSPRKGYSLQMLSGHRVSVATGLAVVSDFRNKNIALGGQGAPLVPFGDIHLFSDYDAFLNLGGICNASVIQDQKVLAWDISACNQVFNHVAQQLGKEFDKDGVIAISGKLQPELSEDLNGLHYYQELAPKSLSNQWVQKDFIGILDRSIFSLQDRMHTAMHHIAHRIIHDLENVEAKRVLVSGGGVYNNALWQYLERSEKVEFIKAPDQIIQYKEALIFAFLGLLRMFNQINILGSYSGAKQDCSGGVVYFP